MKFGKATKILLGLLTAEIWALAIILLFPKARINAIAKAQKATQSAPKSRPVDFD